MTDIKAFTTGTTYKTRFISDSDSELIYTVVSRTKCFVVFENEDGEVIKKKVSVHNGVETVKPLGSYSMAPSLYADKEVEEDTTFDEEELIVDLTEELEEDTTFDEEELIVDLTEELEEDGHEFKTFVKWEARAEVIQNIEQAFEKCYVCSESKIDALTIEKVTALIEKYYKVKATPVEYNDRVYFVNNRTGLPMHVRCRKCKDVFFGESILFEEYADLILP